MPNIDFGFWVLGFEFLDRIQEIGEGQASDICAKYRENCALIRIQAMFENLAMFEKMAMSQKKKKKSGLWDR